MHQTEKTRLFLVFSSMGKKVYNQLLEELDTSNWGNSAYAESQKIKKGDTNA